MDCETSNDLLMDLHYDELDGSRVAELQAHLAGCESCRLASERLSRTRRLAVKLTLPDAPTHSAAVMAALLSTAPIAAATAGRVSAVIPIERAREAAAVNWLQRVGELAMRRQVAMVAISLLMVGLGLRYLPFRSPTQSMNVEASQPEVIPATELTPVPVTSATQGAVQNTASTMRARAPITRPTAGADVHGQNHVLSADGARGATSGDGMNGLGGTAGARAGSAESRAELERSSETEAPTVAAPSSNGLGQVPTDEEHHLQQALPVAPGPMPVSWSAARSSAESASSHGDLAATIVGYQRALALDPPPNERQAIALSLHRALVSAGRSEEANRVRAQYLTQAADPAALAGQVLTSAPRTQTSAGTVLPSSPRPASTRPARRSNSNINTDFNQSAY